MIESCGDTTLQILILPAFRPIDKCLPIAILVTYGMGKMIASFFAQSEAGGQIGKQMRVASQ
jgi:hypothetical protein